MSLEAKSSKHETAMLLFIQVPEKIDDPLNMICMELLILSPLLPGSESVLGKATLHIHNIIHVSTLTSTQPSNKCDTCGKKECMAVANDWAGRVLARPFFLQTKRGRAHFEYT